MEGKALPSFSAHFPPCSLYGFLQRVHLCMCMHTHTTHTHKYTPQLVSQNPGNDWLKKLYWFCVIRRDFGLWSLIIHPLLLMYPRGKKKWKTGVYLSLENFTCFRSCNNYLYFASFDPVYVWHMRIKGLEYSWVYMFLRKSKQNKPLPAYGNSWLIFPTPVVDLTLRKKWHLLPKWVDELHTTFFFSGLFRATAKAYGSSQAGGPVGAAAASLHHSHSHVGSKPHLWPTPQLTAPLDP